VIDRALAFDKADRWPDARSMQSALRAACSPGDLKRLLEAPASSPSGPPTTVEAWPASQLEAWQASVETPRDSGVAVAPHPSSTRLLDSDVSEPTPAVGLSASQQGWPLATTSPVAMEPAARSRAKWIGSTVLALLAMAAIAWMVIDRFSDTSAPIAADVSAGTAKEVEPQEVAEPATSRASPAASWAARSAPERPSPPPVKPRPASTKPRPGPGAKPQSASQPEPSPVKPQPESKIQTQW
jgi:serine/threonine-protein kinase